MPPPTVSVLMVTYRRPTYIAAAVDSLRAQTFSAWELIVVDDSEDDATAQLFAAWQSEPRFRYFHRHQKGGYSNALNFGWRQAAGAYIAILDDDDYWLEAGKLQQQVEFLDAHPGYVACGGWFVQVDQESRELGRVCGPCTDQQIRARLLYSNALCNSTALIRRNAGAYDESIITSDWDLWLRAGQTGGLANLPVFLAAYRVWPLAGSLVDQRQHIAERLRIASRYRQQYPGYAKALAITFLFWMQARVPGLRRPLTAGPVRRLAARLRRWIYPHTVRWVSDGGTQRRQF